MTKILLVEDDKSLREIYGVRLLAEGYDIVSAGDGEEALAMAIKERPQLIVSDVMMPKISGFDMLDILRSTTETKDIKVIMMTALSSEDQRQRGVALGADRYLVKSQVGIEDVVRTVHEVLEDKPTPTPSSTTVTPADAANAASAAVLQPAPGPATAVEPVAAPAAPAAVAMPQPTAPFSTPRPSNLGDRVIQPLESKPADDKDFASMMDAELSKAATEVIGSSPTPPQLPPQEPFAPTPAAEPIAMPAAPAEVVATPAVEPLMQTAPLSTAPTPPTSMEPTLPPIPNPAPAPAPEPATPTVPTPVSEPVISTTPEPQVELPTPTTMDPSLGAPVIEPSPSVDETSATAESAPTSEPSGTTQISVNDAPETTSGVDTAADDNEEQLDAETTESVATGLPQLPTDFVPPEFEETNPSRPPQQ